MADLSVEKAIGADGKITVTGTGFTKTTTKFYVDGVDTPFEVTSETEAVLSGNGGTVYAVKGDTTSATVTIDTQPEPTADTPADAPVVVPDEEGTDPKQMTEEVQASRAETVQEQGIGPRDPYPVGNPPDPTKPDPNNPNSFGAQPIKGDDDDADVNKA